MFWQTQKIVKNIIRHIKIDLGETNFNKLKQNFKSSLSSISEKEKLDSIDSFNFLHAFIKDIILLSKLINSYLTVTEKNDAIEYINKILTTQGLKFDTFISKIINIAGGCSEIAFDNDENEIIKISRENEPKGRIKNEFQIITHLNNFDKKKEFVVIAFSLSSNEQSYKMECAQNSLYNFIIKNNYLELTEKLKIIFQILRAVSFIHKNNVLHRDLHPNNILLFDSNWKLIDFGFSCFLSEIDSAPLLINYGVETYISPEQRDKGIVDIKSEIYSLGKIINFILRRNPSKKDHQLKKIVDICLNRNPKKRFETVDEIIDSMVNELSNLGFDLSIFS